MDTQNGPSPDRVERRPDGWWAICANLEPPLQKDGWAPLQELGPFRSIEAASAMVSSMRNLKRFLYPQLSRAV